MLKLETKYAHLGQNEFYLWNASLKIANYFSIYSLFAYA